MRWLALEKRSSVWCVFFLGNDLGALLEINRAELGENRDSRRRCEFLLELQLLQTGGIENEVGSALDSKFDTVVEVQLVSLDFGAINVHALFAPLIKNHVVSTFRVDHGMIARDARIGNHQVLVAIAADRERHMVERNFTLLRAVHERQLRARTWRSLGRDNRCDRHLGSLRSRTRRCSAAVEIERFQEHNHKLASERSPQFYRKRVNGQSLPVLASTARPARRVQQQMLSDQSKNLRAARRCTQGNECIHEAIPSSENCRRARYGAT